MTELGIKVNPSPPPRPERVELAGRVVTLRPFDLSSHASTLYQATHGPEAEDLWRYMGDGPYPNRAAYEAAFEKKQNSEDPLFWAVIDNSTGTPARCTVQRASSSSTSPARSTAPSPSAPSPWMFLDARRSTARTLATRASTENGLVT